MTRINETFKYSDLKNGIFDPEKDTIIGDSVTFSNPTITYQLIDLNEVKTEKVGKGCYGAIFFPIEFEGTLTVEYTTYDSTRSEVDSDNLSIGNQELSYRRIANKSSVVPDAPRDNIDFRQAVDVEPMLARYLLLQQFTGKRLTSKFVISRSMDDYFENYWNQDDVTMSASTIEPTIPWMRMGNGSGDSLKSDIKEQSLQTTIDGIEAKLNPMDPVMDEAYANIMNVASKLTPKDIMIQVVNHINSRYRPDEYTSKVIRDESFSVIDDMISIDVNGTSYELMWRSDVAEALGRAEDAVKYIGNTNGPYFSPDQYKDVESLMAKVITTAKTANRIELDEEKGNSIRVGLNEVTFIGNEDKLMMDNVVRDSSNYLVGDIYRDAIAVGRSIDSILSRFTNTTILNESARSIDDMLNYLEA